MNFLKANWPAPAHVKAYCSQQGLDNANYNLALHVDDCEQTVLENRKRLEETFQWQHPPVWLQQTHSNQCIDVDSSLKREGDASVTKSFHQSLVILTADCLPILICHQNAPEVAAIHAGWRGLHQGIIKETFLHLNDHPSAYMAWLGPCICQNCYAVQDDFKLEILTHHPDSAHCFINKNQPHFSLKAMATQMLNKLGVEAIYDANECTFENKAFYSYRRSQKTGRIASMIWLENSK